MARPEIYKTSIDYWTVDLGNHFGIWESMENPKEFVNRLNAAIDEEVAAAVASATAERDKTIANLNAALKKAIELLKMYKDMDLAQNESILNCPEETVSRWIAEIRAIAGGQQ